MVLICSNVRYINLKIRKVKIIADVVTERTTVRIFHIVPLMM